MTDLLNLPHWNVLKVQETDLNYVIDATYEVEPAGCPRCGFMICYGHGTKEKLFMDTPIHGNRRGILRDQQAYYMFPPARPRPDYFSGVKISTLVTAIRNDYFLPISTRYSE